MILKTQWKTGTPFLCAKFLAIIVLFVATTHPHFAVAQSAERDILSESRSPIELFAEPFGGVWSVILDPDGVASVSGRAEVSPDGISLILNGPGGLEHYRSFGMELDAAEYITGSGGLSPEKIDGAQKRATIRFMRDTIADAKALESGAVPFTLPRTTRSVVFNFSDAGESGNAEHNLSLPVAWSGSRDGLEIRLRMVDDKPNYADGTWNELDDETAGGGGTTVWSRAEPRIRDVIIVENQLDHAYPFPLKADGSLSDKGGSKRRRLIVYGENLQRLAEAGAPMRASDNTISYAFGPDGVSEDDSGLLLVRTSTASMLAKATSVRYPNPVLINALVKRSAGLADPDNLLFVDVTLNLGVTPGTQKLLLENTQGTWPLLFADQQATLQFGRFDDQVRTQPITAFYPGDIGAVDIIFKTDLSIDSIAVQLMRRPANGEDDENAERDKRGYVLFATRLDELQKSEHETIFRTEPIHFLSKANPKFAPPDDPDAFLLNVNDGDIIGARLLDPARASVRPNVAMANIFGVSEELGELWRGALRKVAACNNETFDGDPLYAMEKSTQFSEITIGELVKYASPLAYAVSALTDSAESQLEFNPSVDVFKGDHAAAILIADELVTLLSEEIVTGPLAALADNENGEIRALRLRAVRERVESVPLIQIATVNYFRKPFWRESTFAKAWKSLIRPYGLISDSTAESSSPMVTMGLGETLDIEALATRLEIPPEEAEEWALEATQGAAKLFLENLGKAIGRAQEAGVCDVEELLVIAGQKSEPAVARIIPQLVNKISHPGPPPREYWKVDLLARGFVERLHSAGGAVRALKEYGAVDDAYKAMAVAVATAGLASTASGSVGAGIMIVGDVADAAYFGAMDLERAIESQDFYDYAQGASLVLGDEILINAEEQRQSTEMAVVGLIAPGIGGIVGLKDLRHFKNIQKGKALAKTLGSTVLDDLDSLTATQKTQLSAYYADTITEINRSGIKNLDSDDLTALDAFSDYETKYGTAPPPGAGPFALPVKEAPYAGADLNDILGPDFKNALEGVSKSSDGKINIMPIGNPDISGAKPISFSGIPLGQGSSNTAFPIDKDLIARVPGGLSGRPKLNAIKADKGGRKVFEGADIDEDKIRMVRLDDTVVVDQDIIISLKNGDIVELKPGDEIEVVEYFEEGSLKSKIKNRPGRKMTTEEAIAYDIGMRELNDQGLVGLDMKYDNFGFETVSEGSKELRLVILDPGGIVPIKGLDPATARRLQSRIDTNEVSPSSLLDNFYKKSDILDDFRDVIDANALGLTKMDEIPFNPLGVSEFPRGRNLASMTDAQAKDYYATLRAAGN